MNPTIAIHDGQIALIVPLGDHLDVGHLRELLATIPGHPAQLTSDPRLLAAPKEEQVEVAPNPWPTCPTCGKTCKTDGGLRVHQAKVHGKSKLRTSAPAKTPNTPLRPVGERLTCPECSATRADQRALDVHIQSKHRQPTPPANIQNGADDKRGNCNLCQQPWKNHPQCTECGCLLGDGHAGGVGVLYVANSRRCTQCEERHRRKSPPQGARA